MFTALFIAGLVPVTLLAGDTHFPAPTQPLHEITEYFRANPSKVAICAFLQFGAAIPLGIYTATMTSRLRFVGARVAGVDIALFGGLAASFMMLVSALGQWTLARPGVADDAALTQGLYHLVFATGGPGHTVPLGLLFAGISVPALFMRVLPRWLAIAGIVLGAIGALSAFTLVIPQALPLVPLTRFPGFVWLIVAGFKLRRDGHRYRRAQSGRRRRSASG